RRADRDRAGGGGRVGPGPAPLCCGEGGGEREGLPRGGGAGLDRAEMAGEKSEEERRGGGEAGGEMEYLRGAGAPQGRGSWWCVGWGVAGGVGGVGGARGAPRPRRGAPVPASSGCSPAPAAPASTHCSSIPAAGPPWKSASDSPTAWRMRRS